jgi:hypothetical protein
MRISEIVIEVNIYIPNIHDNINRYYRGLNPMLNERSSQIGWRLSLNAIAI